MEIITLKTFKTVVDESGLKTAAKKLNTVQSNITARIKRLEKELGVKLFTLNGRKLQLSSAGRELYGYADEILQLECQALSMVSRLKGCFDLRIGVPEPFAAAHMPYFLSQLRKKQPYINPKIHIGISFNLIADVLKKQLDCAVVFTNSQPNGVRVVPFLQEEVVLVYPKYGEYESIIFTREDGCMYRQLALPWLMELGKHGDQSVIMKSVEGILGCVASGLGYTIIGKHHVIGSRHEHDLEIEKLSHDCLPYHSLCFLDSSPFVKDLELFAQLLADESFR